MGENTPPPAAKTKSPKNQNPKERQVQRRGETPEKQGVSVTVIRHVSGVGEIKSPGKTGKPVAAEGGSVVT